jgi:putative DNA primase/helicase
MNPNEKMITPYMIRPYHFINEGLPGSEASSMIRPFTISPKRLPSSEVTPKDSTVEAENTSLAQCYAPESPAPSVGSTYTANPYPSSIQGEPDLITSAQLPVFSKCLPATVQTLTPANRNFYLNGQPITRFSCDDAGNADVFTAYYGDVVRFNCNAGIFHLWNGKAWLPDHSNEVERMAGAVMEKYRNILSAGAYGNDQTLRVQSSHARTSCNLGKINALVGTLKNRHSINQAIFDAHPHLLNVDNGVVDLHTGALYPHNPELMLSKLVQVQYTPGMNHANSLFYRFVRSICGDEALMGYLQTAFGYGITGDIKEHVMFFLKGTGSNGKTTLLEAISNTVGSLLYHLPIGVLISANDPRGGCKHTSELVPAATARMVVASELNESDFLNEGRVKNLTGGSTITLREAYGKCFEAEPSFKIFLDTNYLPKIRGVDEGIWRRVRVIPFDRSFRGEEIDKHLPSKLRQPAEQQAILFWLVQGAIAYCREGLRDAEVVLRASAAYRMGEDTVGCFLSECTEMEHGARIQASALHTAYCEFCSQADLIPQNRTCFGLQLNALGYQKERIPAGNVYLDIRLKNF